MAGIAPVDLDLASLGYLALPNGQLRYVAGLDRLAVDTCRVGAHVYWTDACGQGAGLCDCERRRMFLAPWLSWAWPFFVRRVWSHELAHCVVGPSQSEAWAWQYRHYADLIEPADLVLIQ